MEQIRYPETRTLVVRRKSKASEAPKMSKILSGRTEKGFGFGALKLGGADIEVKGVSEALADDFTKNTLSFVVLRAENGRKIGVGVRFKIPAMVSRRGVDGAGSGRWLNEIWS
ncbi:UNVERIFIED_CONTAM: hypothetical protein Sradi_3402500 [Sesamum radiatum]|uniref:Uncharacterized protein n=1 Tax=Sesamum radiatum TaxID=300843 RepID=A0AAW2R5K6_SESRA